jgi:sulfide:quinone oxidoreductase
VAEIIQLEPDVAVAPQLIEADFADIAARGYQSVVAIRPDGEAPDQLPQAQAAAEAERQGLAFRYLPVASMKVTDDDIVESFARLMDDLPGPILFYCGSSTRCTILWAQAAAPRVGVDAAVAAARNAGHELDFMRETLAARADWAGAMPQPARAHVAPGAASGAL